MVRACRARIRLVDFELRERMRMNSLRWLAAGLVLAASQAAFSATPWSEATHQLAFGDFNGDGRSDVLYIAKDHTLPSGIALSDGTSPSINHQSWVSNYLGIPWH